MPDPFIMPNPFIMLDPYIKRDSFMPGPCPLATTAVTDINKLTTIKKIIILLLWLNLVPI